MRKARVVRNTNETKISVDLLLDGCDTRSIDTGIGFFDHMLDLFFKHGNMSGSILCDGDVNIDAHHSVEDVGIALGKAFGEAIGNKSGIRRYGQSLLPMDEALAQVAVDVSGRPYLVFDADITPLMLGQYDSQLTEEFFRAFAVNAGITLHIRLISGKNEHHKAEAIYKAVARAIFDATTIDERVKGIPSTKGVL